MNARLVFAGDKQRLASFDSVRALLFRGAGAEPVIGHGDIGGAWNGGDGAVFAQKRQGEAVRHAIFSPGISTLPGGKTR